MRETRWRQLDQSPSQPNRWHIGQTQERAVGYLVQLISDRLIELRNPMAVNVAPQRRNPVDVFPAVKIDQHAPLSALDDNGQLPRIVLHRSKRMPDVLPIPLFELFARRRHSSKSPTAEIFISETLIIAISTLLCCLVIRILRFEHLLFT